MTDVGIKDFSKRKIFFIAAVVIVILALLSAVLYALFGGPKAITLVSSDYQTLEKRDNAQRVAISGNIEAQKTLTLSTRLTGPVTQLNVKVGDRVQTDQLVANLDVSDIEAELAKSQAQAAANDATAISQIQGAERQYNQFKELLDKGMNQEINSAQAALRNAETAYDQANRNFQLESALRGNGKQQEIAADQAKIEAARQETINTNVEAARLGLNVVGTIQDQAGERKSLALEQSNLAELEAKRGDATGDKAVQLDAQITAARERVQTLQNSVDKQYRGQVEAGLNTVDVANKAEAANRNLQQSQESYEATLAQADNKLANDQRGVADAFEAKRDAATALAAAQRNAEFQLQNNQAAIDDAVRNARASQATNGIGDNKLKMDIASAQVRAPFDGVVTNVAAKQGMAASGPLLTIADDARMIVTANVKEIDIDKISVGQRVEFTTPGTGSKKFQGKVTFVSPVADSGNSAAAAPSAGGAAAAAAAAGTGGGGGSTNKVNFPVEIEVLGNKGTLRLGSTAKARIITREASDKLIIPQTAVFEDQGKKKVLAISEDDTIVERTVKLGSKTDSDVEVLSGEAKKGEKILIDATKYRANVGQKVEVSDTPEDAAATTTSSAAKAS